MSPSICSVKAGMHLRRGNTKPRPYEAASTRLVWTAHVYYTLSMNGNKPHLLPWFDVPTADRLVHAMDEAIASGQCIVHTTQAETVTTSVLPHLKCAPVLIYLLEGFIASRKYIILCIKLNLHLNTNRTQTRYAKMKRMCDVDVLPRWGKQHSAVRWIFDKQPNAVH